ncbi:MAG: ATP-binding protein [Solirubrobacterales bacterium]
MRVSTAAALDTPLDELLKVIAVEASHVTRAGAASILLTEPGPHLRLGASIGLSDDYIGFLQGTDLAIGRNNAQEAAVRLEPVILDDLRSAPLRDATEMPLRVAAEREGFASLMSVPLIAGRQSFGAMSLHRRLPGPWFPSEVELASTFAQHAAGAIDTSRLSESKRRQLEALERLVGVLREQTHEYANRLHALSGLHALGETEEAERFLAQLMTLHHDNYASVIERVHHPVLAGLLVAQMSVARQRGVEVRLSQKTKIESLPKSLGSAEAVTIIANLIENAVEAVANMPSSRRKATIRFVEKNGDLTIKVRDFGPGIAPEAVEKIFDRGTSSKEGHPGIGLALVSEAVASANGEISVDAKPRGTCFTVTLPGD